jgi:hypothetical protein
MAWLLDESAWPQSQAFLLLGQGTTEVALQKARRYFIPIQALRFRF